MKDIDILLQKLVEFDEKLVLIDAELQRRVITKNGAFHDVREHFNSLLDSCAKFEKVYINSGVLDRGMTMFHEKLKETLFCKSLFLSHILRKPFGYAGDFLAIDMIYKKSPQGEGVISLLETCLFEVPACKAVRNRKDFLIEFLVRESIGRGGRIEIFNLASGPAREIAEFANVTSCDFDCTITNVDIDKKALDYAKGLVNGGARKIDVRYVEDNAYRIAMRRTNAERYGKKDLVICSGLFDYLEESWAIRLLKALHCLLNDGGVLVVGNFSDKREGGFHMEWFADWHIIQRSRAEFKRLFEKAGLHGVIIENEPLGINLFGIMRKSV